MRNFETGPMEEKPCLPMDLLRKAFAKGRFADPVEALRALDHFGWSCQSCWRHLADLATERSKIDLAALEDHALSSLHEPPVALALGRLITAANQPDAAAALAPMHRYLLGETTWTENFDFWWLLIEESRGLALKSKDRQIARWQTFRDDALDHHRCGNPDHDLELDLLVLTYQADEFRVEGQSQAAAEMLVYILERAERCRPEIRASVYEIQADLSRVNLGKPLMALKYLLKAERLLRDNTIPGRLAEVRTRIALTQLGQNQIEPAFANFTEALESIPQDTDPRLRLEILLHLAAIQARRGNTQQTRHHLSEAKPYLESHASKLMLAQSNWLWGLVYVGEDQLDQAETCLLKALRAFFGLGDCLARVRILLSLIELYSQTQNASRLEMMLAEFAVALNHPGLGTHFSDAVKQALQNEQVSSELIH